MIDYAHSRNKILATNNNWLTEVRKNDRKYLYVLIFNVFKNMKKKKTIQLEIFLNPI